MNYLPFFRFVFIIFSPICFGFTACSSNQRIPDVDDPLASANARPINSGEGKELKVEGTAEKLVTIEGELKAGFLSQPMPEVWLSNTQTGERVDLSPDSQRVLKAYWVEKLSNVYCTEIVRAGAQAQIDCDKRLTRIANKVDRELQSQTITVDGSNRSIYEEESGNLIRFMGLAAFDLVEELKQQGLEKQ